MNPSNWIVNVYYVIVLAFFALFSWILFQVGPSPKGETHLKPSIESPLDFLLQSIHEPIPLLLVQIVIVAGFARALGILFNRKLKQPSVIGEIVGGILLGPSLLGWISPELQTWLFPKQSLAMLGVLSQIGLIFFMFIIGMELDLKILKTKARSAIIISHASIVFPFFLGMVLAYFLYEPFAPDSVDFVPFTLFLGIAMSVTAFPVLARILQERNLTKTTLGALAITCAAADDITAWILLAIIVTIAKAGSSSQALLTIALCFFYILGMVFLIAPFLQRLGNIYVSREYLTRTAIAILLLILFASAFVAEAIGIHALFGAFLAGVVMPTEGNLKKIISEKFEDISVILFLPIFFALTGLKTKLPLLADPNLWPVFFAVLGFAVVGKFIGSAGAARVAGVNWEDSLSIGALMNTRGLLELVVLNIGYELGILSTELFSVFVLMALLTTISTGPALDLIQSIFQKNEASSPGTQRSLHALVAFAQEKMGRNLVRLAFLLSGNQRRQIQISALHISPNDSLTSENMQKYRDLAFETVRQTGEEIGVMVHTEFRITDNITYEIINYTKSTHANVLFIGAAKSLFSKSLTGGKLKSILNYSPVPVVVLIDQGWSRLDFVTILKQNEKDPILDFLDRLLVLRSPRTRVLGPKEWSDPATLLTTLKKSSLAVLDLSLWEELDFEKQEDLPTSFVLVKFPHD